MRNVPDVAILLDRFGSGGVERVGCLVASGLVERGFSVEMVVLEDDGPARPLLSDKVAVRGLGFDPAEPRGKRMKRAVRAIAAYLRERSPRLLHAPGNHTIRPAADAAEQAGFPGPFVAKVTNPLAGEKTRWWRKHSRRQAYAKALRRADTILVLSPAGMQEIAALDGSLRGRTRVIHNPYVSDTMLQRAAERSRVEPPVILAVGRLSEQKNQALLLRAAARLKGRAWQVRLCGTGPDEAALRALAADLGIADRVEFAGFVSDPVSEYLGATVLAQSSRWEGLPATVLEAMACGCPVVATASSPGLVELLREVGAREPVAVGDEAGFAAALGEALDGQIPAVPPRAALPYGIEASLDEHAALFRESVGGG